MYDLISYDIGAINSLYSHAYGPRYKALEMLKSTYSEGAGHWYPETSQQPQ